MVDGLKVALLESKRPGCKVYVNNDGTLNPGSENGYVFIHLTGIIPCPLYTGSWS